MPFLWAACTRQTLARLSRPHFSSRIDYSVTIFFAFSLKHQEPPAAASNDQILKSAPSFPDCALASHYLLFSKSMFTDSSCVPLTFSPDFMQPLRPLVRLPCGSRPMDLHNSRPSANV